MNQLLAPAFRREVPGFRKYKVVLDSEGKPLRPVGFSWDRQYALYLVRAYEPYYVVEFIEERGTRVVIVDRVEFGPYSRINPSGWRLAEPVNTDVLATATQTRTVVVLTPRWRQIEDAPSAVVEFAKLLLDEPDKALQQAPLFPPLS